MAGREFNLSVLASESGPQVLPPAEIDFAAYPADKPRIVGYQAKWDEASFEYHHTPRRFDFPPSDSGLVAELGRLAIGCWHQFGLRGYARVDFRVDRQGRPWILEVNSNPCLSLDAGFAAAVERAEMTYDEAIRRIVQDALATAGSPPPADRNAHPKVARVSSRENPTQGGGGASLTGRRVFRDRTQIVGPASPGRRHWSPFG